MTSFSTVVKEFVVDYTSPTFEPLMEHEVNGLDYRYVYGNDRLSVNITGVETSSGNLVENGNQIRLYYHMDYLGTTDYLTSPVSLKVTSWTHYNEWGEITHNAVLKTGKRELDLVKRYATHDYDAVLGMYYAKARFYDAENRRFAAVDPVKGEITNPLTMVQYIYAIDCPLIYIDVGGNKAEAVDFAGVGGSAAPKQTTNTPSTPKPTPSNSTQSSNQFTVTANQVRMRSGPGLNYSTVGYLNKGDKVINLKQTHDQDGYSWQKVQVNGKICWVADHYLKSSTGTSTSETPPTVSVLPPSDISKLHEIDFYQSSRHKGYDEYGNIANDMKFGDYTYDQIDLLHPYFSFQLCEKPDVLFAEFRDMVRTFFAMGDLERIALDMIDHFKNGGGQEYTNPSLIRAVKNHPNTQAYVESVKEIVIGALSQNNGDLNVLKGQAVLQEIEKLPRIKFDGLTDTFLGLRIMINDTWGNSIRVENYKITGKTFQGTLHFDIYDHFGLDEPDVLKIYGDLAGFRAWFVLQHYDQFAGQYKPFVTNIDLYIPFNGSVA